MSHPKAAVIICVMEVVGEKAEKDAVVVGAVYAATDP